MICLPPGLLPGTGAATKPERRSLALGSRTSGGPAAWCSLQPASSSPSTSWKMVSPQPTQGPNEEKREPVSSSRPQTLLGQRITDGYHLTKILTPEHSQHLLSSLGPASKNQPVPAQGRLNISSAATFFKNLEQPICVSMASKEGSTTGKDGHCQRVAVRLYRLASEKPTFLIYMTR